MRFRSTTSVENVVEMYAAFTAVYQPNPTISEPAVATTARRSRDHVSPRRRIDPALPAIVGSAHPHTASAPTDQRAYSRFARGLVAASASEAIANAAGTTASCSRTSGATSDASTAPAIHQRVRNASAFAIR